MAFGRDTQDKVDAEKYRSRRAKQRGYQKRYRRRLIVEGVPERDAMADACLVAMIEVLISRRENVDRLRELGLVNRMLDNLEVRGANRVAAKSALQRMVDRFRDAADRERREAEMEATYQARLARERA